MRIRTILLLSVIVGAMLGALSLYVGFQHNAQGELVHMDSGAIDYWYAASVFLSWAAPVAVVIFLLGLIFYFARKLLFKSSEQPASDERSGTL